MSIPQRPIRLGIAGCGEVVRFKHLPELQRLPEIRVVAVADPDENARKSLAHLFAISGCFADLESMLASAEVDAVAICSPPVTHAELAVTAIDAGRHVWIDKPLAVREEDCRHILASAERSSRVVATGFHMRSHRIIQRARQAIDDSILGTIESIRSVWNSPRADEGIPSWRTDRTLGGGALIELGVHHYDLWRYLSGSDVAEVYAQSRDGVRHDEAATVSARLANGVLCTAMLSERTPHAIEIEVCGSVGRLRLNCLRFDGFESYGRRDVAGSPGVRLRSALATLGGLPGGLTLMRKGGDYKDSYRRAWLDFARAILEERPPPATALDGVRASEVAAATVESLRTGSRVSVS
jgi:myo-inositol 2-dehydrogenase / D-chiro-inositol 1-dehydrogenase